MSRLGVVDMESLCFCQVPRQQVQFAQSQADHFQTWCREGANLDQTITLNFEDLKMLFHFFKCNGPRLTRYKRRGVFRR